MARVTGDAQFACEARRLARLIARTGTPTYLYSYEYEIDTLAADHVIQRENPPTPRCGKARPVSAHGGMKREIGLVEDVGRKDRRAIVVAEEHVRLDASSGHR